MPDYQVICCVVNHEKGSRVLREARKHGVPGGTISIARGTAKSRVLEILGLNDSRKEIVFLAAERSAARAAADAIAKDLAFEKSGHGIALLIPLSRVAGTGHLPTHPTTDETEAEAMHQVIFTVVELGNGGDVVDAATAAGAKGATIWHGRGSGVHETEVLFGMPVEPEREIVMIVADTQAADGIVAAVCAAIKIDEPGNGILFVCPVSRVYGLRK